MKRFRAIIYKVGINRCVDVPPEIVRNILGNPGSDPYIPVIGEANGHAFRGTVLPRGRLYLNTAIRKVAGVDTGNTVELTLALDKDPRDPPMPLELAEHREALELLPPGQRREILQWMGAAKGKTTRATRVRKVMAHLAKKGIL